MSLIRRIPLARRYLHTGRRRAAQYRYPWPLFEEVMA